MEESAVSMIFFSQKYWGFFGSFLKTVCQLKCQSLIDIFLYLEIRTTF